MKKRSILVHSIFLTLIALSLVGFCLATEHQYRIDAEQDDIFGGSFTVFFCLFLFFPVFSFEIELYRVVRYFALCKHKSTRKTVINLISVLLIPVLYLISTIITYRMEFRAVAVSILEIPALVAPLHFLIMRMVTWSWWCAQLEESSNDDAQNEKGQPS